MTEWCGYPGRATPSRRSPWESLLRSLFFAAAFISLTSACRVWAQTPDLPREELTGTLEGGWMGIGGEHTGWVLRTDADPATPIEVDVSCCKTPAAELD